MGKYDEVVKNLARLPEGDTRNERVLKFRDEYLRPDRDSSISTLAKTYALLRKQKKEAEEVVSQINERIEAVMWPLVDSYEAEGISSLKLETGQTVTVQLEPQATVEDRAAFRQWCVENGHESELVLPWQTANAITKEKLLAGEPEPTGIKAFIRTKLVLRGK